MSEVSMSWISTLRSMSTNELSDRLTRGVPGFEKSSGSVTLKPCRLASPFAVVEQAFEEFWERRDVELVLL